MNLDHLFFHVAALRPSLVLKLIRKDKDVPIQPNDFSTIYYVYDYLLMIYERSIDKYIIIILEFFSRKISDRVRIISKSQVVCKLGLKNKNESIGVLNND